MNQGSPEERTDINLQGGEQGSGLQTASYKGHEKIVQLLLSKGVDINTQGEEYGSALQAASYGGHDNIAKLLLSKVVARSKQLRIKATRKLYNYSLTKMPTLMREVETTVLALSNWRRLEGMRRLSNYSLVEALTLILRWRVGDWNQFKNTKMPTLFHTRYLNLRIVVHPHLHSYLI